VSFFEVHAANHMGAGGLPHRYLERIRAHYPLSIHGVGLSTGSDQPLDRAHLARLRTLLACYRPESFPSTWAWSTHDGVFPNDLLPVPYDSAKLARVCTYIDQVQEVSGRHAQDAEDRQVEDVTRK